MAHKAEQTQTGTMIGQVAASVIVPTLNGATRIRACLDALTREIAGRAFEIVVVDDGSTDAIQEAVASYPDVRLIRQSNSGPATARNRGALEARGDLILFTDDDCAPAVGWLDAMLAPFGDAAVVGVKGVYRTDQPSLAARFVQIEYEDKYRLMAGLHSIDFVDTYSAGFRRGHFLEIGGYDTSFPVACAEDIELSYRMSARGWVLKFVPDAVVFHTHPNTFAKYLRKKYKFAFWRVLAVRKNPAKGVKDSHTPQIMKLQLLLLPALIVAIPFDLVRRPKVSATAVVLAAFTVSTVPFAVRATRSDPAVGLLSPLLLAARACAQFLGVAGGIGYARRNSATPPARSPALKSSS